MKHFYFCYILLAFLPFSLCAQNNVGIGTTTPNPKALLDLSTSDKGILIPRLTTTQRLAIPANAADNGLLVYDVTDELFYYWKTNQWVGFPLPSYNQLLTFNAGTQLLSLTDGGGTLTTNLPMFNTAIGFNVGTQTLTLTDAGGSLTTNLPMFNTAIGFNVGTQTLTLTDAGGSLTTNLPMFNTAIGFNNATQTLSITDAGGTLTTPLQVNNISLVFDSLTQNLSLTDGGGTLTTLLNLNVDDYDWTRNAPANIMFPSNLSDRIGIGTNTPVPSAMLDIQSADKGVILPRMTTAQRLAIVAPATGLELFDVTANVKMYYNGTRWLEVGAVPIGSIQAWHKSMAATPALAWGWVECNGQVLADPESPYNGNSIPDLNAAERFLRGNAISGNMQAGDIQTHIHTGTSDNAGDHAHTVDAPPTNSSQNGNHNHGGSTGGVNSGNNGVWIPYDDNTSDNCEGDWTDDNPSLCGSGWNGKNTSGNFMGRIDGACLNHNHSISGDGNHLHTTDIVPFASANAGNHTHTFTTNATGGTETRPVNMSVVWIMRVK